MKKYFIIKISLFIYNVIGYIFTEKWLSKKSAYKNSIGRQIWWFRECNWRNYINAGG